MCASATTPPAFRYPPILNYAAWLILTPAAVFLWQTPCWWLVLFLWPLQAHLGHVLLTGFHEASHYSLARNYWLNELMGILVGIVVFIPLSVYRHLHMYHHSRLGSETDYELWPYTITRYSRPFRVAAAAIELTLGFFFTPLLFLRGALVDGRVSRAVAGRMVAEYVVCLAAWAAALSVIAWHGWWGTFLAAYLLPSMIAGNLQSLRKFVEHMGLTGDTPMTATRTVVHPNSTGKMLSASIHFVNYHGTHHRFGKLAYFDLPSATDRACELESQPLPVYTSYARAFFDMLPSLADPRVGPQWRRECHAQQEASQPAAPAIH